MLDSFLDQEISADDVEELVSTPSAPTSFDGLPANESMWNYNCLDCVYTREVGEVSADAAAKLGLTHVDQFQHEVFPAVFQAMVEGVRIDLRERARMDAQLVKEMAERQELIDAIATFPLNVRSPLQMKKFFYDDLKLPIVWKRRPDGGRTPSLDDKALDFLKTKEPVIRPIVRSIQEMRSLGVFLSTFTRAKLDYDDRMRCSYNICGTETYRFASAKNVFGTGTNLANIPMGGEDDESDLVLPNIRTIFIPDEGNTFFDLDLSKADLRIVVAESKAQEMQAMLDEGRDPYVETAREFYHDPSINKSRPDGSADPKYKMFKSFCHGTHYLGTPNGLSQRLGLTIREAERTQTWYFGKYPQIKTWQETFIAEIRRTHSVRNKFGYVRNYLGRIDDSTFREAIAWLPQSTVAIFINKIWTQVFKHAPSIRVLLQVHDSLAGQFPTAQRGACLDDLRRLARIEIPYDTPLVIPIGVKTSEKSWGHCG